jgi:nicotinamide mononucleotide transporter
MDSPAFIEYPAAALALAGVWLMVMRRRTGWILNFFSCLLYMLVFYRSKLYGDAGLQVFFAAMQVWGWLRWKNYSSEGEIPLRSMDFDGLWNTLLLVIGGSLLLGLLLSRGTDSDVPWTDASCTAGSITAQILQIARYRENWLLWILVNLVYVPLYLYKELPATAILYSVFFMMAVGGLWQWNKKLRKQQHQAPA